MTTVAPTTSGTRMHKLRTRLQRELQPLQLEIHDDSALHAGHVHAGAGHFSVRIVASVFATRAPLERHRMIYAALGNLLQTDIHALSITALAPGESR
ncbi:MAG: BolA family protein [Gammaproteobacteria bacterium]